MKKILAILLLLTTVTIYSQVGEESTGMSIGLTNQTIDGLNYQSVAFMPELNLGFFGIGLNLDIRFTLKIIGTEPTFEIYQPDWVIDDGDWQDYLSLYLAKLSYIRLGHKDDPFYLKAGQFKDATLGNGTILNQYSNMQHLPERRIFGAALDIDGDLFNFPYVGFESFISNVGAMDVLGGRLFVRPLKSFGIPIVSNIELAGTGVIDRDPYFFSTDPTAKSTEEDAVVIAGADVTIPVLDSILLSMDIYGDLIFQNSTGARIYGIGGKVISLIHYRLQYIDQDKNYIQEYFGAMYDLSRTGNNFNIYKGNDDVQEIPAKQDMNATLGFEIPKLLYFDASLSNLLSLTKEQEFTAIEAPYLYPSLKGTLHIDNELLKIVSADFFYFKNGIDSFKSIVNPVNAIIGGTVNYYSGNMVVAFTVDIKYNEDGDPDDKWITNTQLSVNFEL